MQFIRMFQSKLIKNIFVTILQKAKKEMIKSFTFSSLCPLKFEQFSGVHYSRPKNSQYITLNLQWHTRDTYPPYWVTQESKMK